MKKVLLAHPFGNANVRHALLAMQENEALEAFITTVTFKDGPLLRRLPLRLRGELLRRSYKLYDSQISSYPSRELVRLLLTPLSRRVPRLARLVPTVDSIWKMTDRQLMKRLAAGDATALVGYAYEDGAYLTFSRCSSQTKIYELPIGYWRSMHQLLREEAQIQPQWNQTLRGLGDSEEKLRRKDVELELANHVFVPSRFVYETIPLQYRAKTTIIPYGCPPPRLSPPEAKRRDEPLKVLFCGSLGQRKGISYLFEACERLRSRVTLTVVGTPVAMPDVLRRHLQSVTWYPSLPHAKLLTLMDQHDVFLFPTLFEGRALVVTEALSRGLPVITTLNSGADDLIINDETGFLVPIRSVDEIETALEKLIRYPDKLDNMKSNCLAAAARWEWADYRELLGKTLSGIL